MKLERVLLGILSILSLLLTIHAMQLRHEKKQDVGVVYLQDFNASLRAQQADEVCEAWAQLFHKIWIDNPVYVEGTVFKMDEYARLDSLANIEMTDMYAYWSDEDSITYRRRQRMIQPDEYPYQPQ